MNDNIIRCWKTNNPLYLKYHDEEWGVPIRDDNSLFEFLILGGFQAGLTWELILNKRENFRRAFDYFDPKKIICYNDRKIDQLMIDKGIIRNKAKIHATIHNAHQVLKIKEKHGSFSSFIWAFSPNNRSENNFESFSELPNKSDESILMSRELKKHGFKFVGPTICYAFMQAVGIVNDHIVQCFRRYQIMEMRQATMIGQDVSEKINYR